MADPFARRDGVDVDMAGVKVMVGIPAGRDLPALTVKSLITTFAACQERKVSCQLGMVVGSAVVQWARDEVVDIFLASDCNRLFWIDSDMVWKPEQFLRMLVLSQLKDVVVASYPAKQDRPTFYLNHDPNQPLVADEHGLVEIRGIGLGFTVMRREVLERLSARARKVRDAISGREIPAIFRIDDVNLERRGEDMAFFADVREAGYKVLLDPTVDLGHIGSKQYTGSIRDALRLL